MAFVGLITRKETDTGVNLLAKVVSPSKTKSAYKIIPVRIKSNGLSDFDCCTIDLGTVTSKLNRDYNFDKLDKDIILINNGEHGTNISYIIINSDETTSLDAEVVNSNNPDYLTTYLDTNGKIKKKPLFGNENVLGTIKIIVSKNEASVTRTIPVTLQSITAQEVLNEVSKDNGSISKVKLFSKLINDDINLYDENDVNVNNSNIKNELGYGVYGIRNEFTLIDEISDNSLSTIPINIEWSFEDKTNSFAKAIYDKPDYISDIEDINQIGRIFIDNTSKKAYVSTPTYSKVCERINKLNDTESKNYFSKGFGDLTSNTALKIRISGLTIKAKLTISNKENTDKADLTYTYSCKTSSKYLCSDELTDTLVKPNMRIFVLGIDTTNNKYIKRDMIKFNGADSSDDISDITSDNIIYKYDDETDNDKVTSAYLYLGVFGTQGLAIHLSDDENTWLTDRDRIKNPETFKDYYLLDKTKLSGIALNDTPLLLKYNTDINEAPLSHTYPLSKDAGATTIDAVTGVISDGSEQMELRVIKINMLTASSYIKENQTDDNKLYTDFVLKCTVSVSYNTKGVDQNAGNNLKCVLFSRLSIPIPSFNEQGHLIG